MKRTPIIAFLRAVLVVLVLFCSSQIHAQKSIVVKGYVKTISGEPLSSASISIKNGSIQSTTDSTGSFTIKVPSEESIIVVKYTNYKDYEKVVGTDSVLNIVLSPDVSNLDDVIVIAYGTASKRTVSNAISTVSARDIADKPVTNALQAVQGKMPGVNIQQGTGAPGDEPQVKVRGMGSVGAGNSPLYVVDGVPLTDASSFNMINPDDIQSIDVLKDAAAAAMYGSRAGNGVILVTTKKGRSGAAKIQVNTMYGTQEVSKTVKVLNRDEYVDYVKDAFKNANREVPSIFNRPDSMGNTNWQDEIFRKAPTSNIELSVSGGSEGINYFVSGYKLDQEGILKGTGMDRYGFRSNLNVNIKPWLKMGLNVAPSYSIIDIKPAQGTVNGAVFNSPLGGNPVMGSPITLAVLLPPFMPVFMPNGIDYASFYNWPQSNSTGGSLSNILAFNGQHYNPVQILDLYKDKYKVFRGVGNAFLQLEPIKGLVIKTSLGGEFNSGERAWTRPATLANDAGTQANISNPLLTVQQSSLIKGSGYSWVWENTINYKKTFANMHNIDVVAGYAAQKFHTEAISVTSRSGTATNLFTEYPTNATAIDGVIPSYGENTLLSTFGRVQYNYDYRYMISAAIRRDGSSRFGTSNRYATFPSVSAAWAISEESFFEKGGLRKVINDLKFRVSWGKTGNYNIGDFTRQGRMTAANYSFGTGTTPVITPGFAQSSFDLNQLTWETNDQLDLGLDFTILKNRVDFTIDYYDRKTKDLLLDVNIPALVGFATTVKQNVGSVSNKGFELGLNTQNFVKAFKWNSSFNISFNKNKILSLVGNQTILRDIVPSAGYQGNIRHVVGGSIGDFYGLQHIGVYMNAADSANSPRWTGLQPSGVGDIKYADVNGDGKIDVNDVTKIGSPQPKFTYGFSNNFSYKGFDLNIVVQGVYGGQIANAIVRYSNTFLGGDNPLAYALDRWRSEQDPGNGMIPKAKAWLGTANPGPLQQFSSWNLSSASYLRINNITLGYNFTKLIFKKDQSQKSARFYFTVMNLHTFSSYAGFNPDVNMYGKNDDSRLGVDQGAYPLARSFVFGAKIGF